MGGERHDKGQGLKGETEKKEEEFTGGPSTPVPPLSKEGRRNKTLPLSFIISLFSPYHCLDRSPLTVCSPSPSTSNPAPTHRPTDSFLHQSVPLTLVHSKPHLEPPQSLPPCLQLLSSKSRPQR